MSLASTKSVFRMGKAGKNTNAKTSHFKIFLTAEENDRLEFFLSSTHNSVKTPQQFSLTITTNRKIVGS